MKTSRPLFYIMVALVLFALGYAGYGLYHAKWVSDIQHGPVPALPTAAPHS